ncbi:MAG: signal recognition particle-docking protein FtsY [Acidobacteria bacterium RIFCSPLOWO2_12_FULL_60_22]|nr:MAG: signal recognition particle-docking protein FtsY [Acidobacteria bacterium RIFCSPLOWO2_12_FULL_60_22]
MIQTLFGTPEAKPGLFERFQKAVQSTKSSLVTRVEEIVRGRTEIDEALLEKLEEVLIAGDVGLATTQEVLEAVRQQVRRGQLQDAAELKSAVKAQLLNILRQTSDGRPRSVDPPAVILVVGVNGTGKTTTIGKLAYQLGSEGKKVLLCAGDTFRAAAVEQLEIWGQRTGCEVIKQRPGADPSAVLFDALTSAKARHFDCVIADTAGRLHTKVNLMAEMEKMRRTSQRVIPGSPHEVLLILDGTTGQNGLQQARQFTEHAGVTGIVLTKLDGTAKGGVVLAIARELKLPIRYVGVGEQKEDLLPFDPEQFIESLFA